MCHDIFVSVFAIAFHISFFESQQPGNFLIIPSCLKCSLQATAAAVILKSSFPCCRHIRLHQQFLVLGSVGKLKKKIVTSRKPFVFKIAVLTAVNGTLFPCFLGCLWSCILVGITVVHYQQVSRKNRAKRGKSKDECRFC